MNAKPLKVYYCRSCGMRMPLYYKKDAPYRDENWWHCYRCHSSDLIAQVEAWIPQRENAVNQMCTQDTLQEMMQSAELMHPPAPSAPQQQGWGQRQPSPAPQQDQRQAWGQHQGQRQGQWQRQGQPAAGQQPQRPYPRTQQATGQGGWQKPPKQTWPQSPQRKPAQHSAPGRSAPQNNALENDPFWNA